MLCGFHFTIKAQTAYLTTGNTIYYYDYNTCALTDSAIVSTTKQFASIALNSNGQVYGKKEENDSIFIFYPDTKAKSFVCKITPHPNLSFTSDALACDYQNNIICVEYRTEIGLPNSVYIVKYNPVTCQRVAEYKIPGVTGVDPDIEFINGNYYFGINASLYELDVVSDTIPILTKVFNNSLPNTNIIKGLFATCYRDSAVFIGVDNDFNNGKSIVIKYNPVTNRNDTMCVLNQIMRDAAFYYSKPNYFYLGQDSTFCKGTVRKIRTNYTNTVWSTGQTGNSITVTVPGKYWATVTDSCGTYTDTITLDTIVQKRLFVGRDTTICKGATLTFTSNFTNTKWNSNLTDSIITIMPTKDTILIGKVAYTCYPNDSMRDTVIVKVDTTTNIQVSANATTYCNQPISLTKNNSNAIWNNGSTTNNIIVNSAGKYWAILTNTCGTFSDTVEIQSFSSTPLNIGRDTSICTNANFTIVSNLAKTIWSTGDTAKQITVNSAGTYWATIKDSCNTYNDTIHITAYSPETIILSNDTTVCKNTALTITSTNANTQFGNGIIANQLTVAITKDTLVIGKVINKCAPSGFNADTVVIKTITEEPLILSSTTTVICDTETVVLNSSVINTTWTLPDSTQLNAKSITINKTGTYLASYQGECTGFLDSIVIMQFCDEYCSFFAPSAFTPNGDNLNDNFQIFEDCIKLSSFLLKIYNRWGELLFTSDTVANQWDGTFKGIPTAQDSYIWYIEYETKGVKKIDKGIVTVLR